MSLPTSPLSSVKGLVCVHSGVVMATAAELTCMQDFVSRANLSRLDKEAFKKQKQKKTPLNVFIVVVLNDIEYERKLQTEIPDLDVFPWQHHSAIQVKVFQCAHTNMNS